MPREPLRTRTFALACAAALIAAFVAGMAGCAKPLLAPDKPRSQYDRFDAARNVRAEQYVFDEYGRRQPNLRERLLPKE
ncbi:MAG: hypothetical protein RBS39_05710 [Phycisphaerales bacterium]|jgi:hypothetical protein|nr:hypothetical protein [Phycisphaerales bacterium]